MLEPRIAIGISVTTATVAILVVGFFRTPRRREFPPHGWFGIVALAGAEWLLLRRIEPVTTYFTPIAWSAYILVVDAAVFALTGRSRLRDAPIVVTRMALLSIPLWLIFEAYNFHLRGWTYVGVPQESIAALFGYGWSFATITPAIFETSDLVQALMPPVPIHAWQISHTVENVAMICGAACLVMPLIVPNRFAPYMVPLLWIGFVLLVDPINKRLALPSFLGDLSEGFARRLYGFLWAGWICGWLWEFWNNWAGAKWHYTFPMFQRWKIFEMPAPGYLGFLPFAMECFTMYVTAAWLAGWLKRVK
ncbi:MAG TPA: hypothetical protein VEJ38_01460 [Candidatus Acidoferrales bacterium]|nr:hypothetical protein [Candidatus Acidoferrales bacterium]